MMHVLMHVILPDIKTVISSSPGSQSRVGGVFPCVCILISLINCACLQVYKYEPFFKYVRFTCSANSVVHVVDYCWSFGGLFVDVVILGGGVGGT